MMLRRLLIWAVATLAITPVRNTTAARADDDKQAINIHVLVPADATLEVDGYYKTKSTGASRRFVTPPLTVGKSYTYTLKVTSKGKSITKDIKVRYGSKNTFDLRSEFQAEVTPPPPKKLTATEAHKIGVEAYIYGYPLVTMEMTRRVMTNIAMPDGKHAPMGQFANMRSYPTPAFKDVTAPNADTLYSAAWLDLKKEPYIFSIPDADGRYFLMPMLDGWTDVFQVPGKRTTGTKAQKYALTGPGWKGKLPEGVKQYKSPTNLVWIIGRTYCTGTPEDYQKVHEFQDKLSLVPLSAYGKPYTPPKGKVDPKIDMTTPVRDQVNRMDAAQFFKLFAKLLKNNPPGKADGPMVARLAKIGIVPGKDFAFDQIDPEVAKGLAGVPKAGFAKIMAHYKNSGKEINGWTFTLKTGLYGFHYLQRAFITAVGLGANRPQDAVYPMSEVDVEGKAYSGANKYVLHFPKGKLPPVNGFWSLTMYDAQMFFVPNSLKRYTLSSRFKFNYQKDGSLDLYLQKDSPGKDKEANWLPAPSGKFVLMLRLYWPKKEVLEGKWEPPGVKRIEGNKEKGNKKPAAAALPGLMLGKWIVKGEDMDGSMLEFSNDGTLHGEFRINDKLAVLKGTIQVDNKVLRCTTVNPKTNMEETNALTIIILTKTQFIVEDKEGKRIKMERPK